ncbi:hypothetical protein D3C85_1335540 [compost metagenome]
MGADGDAVGHDLLKGPQPELVLSQLPDCRALGRGDLGGDHEAGHGRQGAVGGRCIDAVIGEGLGLLPTEGGKRSKTPFDGRRLRLHQQHRRRALGEGERPGQRRGQTGREQGFVLLDQSQRGGDLRQLGADEGFNFGS